MFIYELKLIIEVNGKEYKEHDGFFASVDAVYNYLSRVSKPTIVGQNDNSEETVKNGIRNRMKIRAIVPSYEDEETGIFVDEYEQDYIVYMHYVNE